MSPLSARESGQVDLLRRQYLQLLEPDLLTIPSVEMLRRPDVQHLLYDNMFNSDNLMFAPTGRYQLRVVKELVLRIETSFADPEEDVGFPSYPDYIICCAFLGQQSFSLASAEPTSCTS